LLFLLTSTLGAAQPGSGPPAVPAFRQATNIAVITIKDEITLVTLKSVERRLRLAERAGADAVVFEIDTPGGSVSATIGDPAILSVKGISPIIKGTPIRNTVAWINPHAYSAGAIIALACREIVTSDPAAMGDAIPIVLNPATGLQTLGEQERQKILAPLMADVVDSARRNGWDEFLVQGVVTTGVELWWIENAKTGQRMAITREEFKTLFGQDPPETRPRLFAPPPGTPRPLGNPMSDDQRRAVTPAAPGQVAERSGALPPVAPNDPTRFAPASPALEPLTQAVTLNQTLAGSRPPIDPARRADWKVVDYVSTGDGPYIFSAGDMLHYGLSSGVVRTDRELMQFFGARYLLRLDQSWSEGLVAVMTNLYVRAVLIVVFLIALFLEMTHPGVVLPGTIAALALIGLIAPPMLIDLANWWEVAAIITGIILLALEVFVIPGFGIFGIVGIVALFGGLVGTFVPEGGVFPNTPGARNDLLYGVTTIVLSTATAGAGIYFLSKHLGSLPLLGSLVLSDSRPDEASDEGFLAAMAPEPVGPVTVGARGRAVTPLRPAGRVEVADRIIDAVAEMGYIPAGTDVVVTGVSAFRITVEPAPPGAM
jgi:membrane-bound serine protease (ClpP class)